MTPPGQVIKTFTSKKGHAATLRYPKKEDLNELLDFANGIITEDTFVQLSGKLKTKKEEEEFLEETLEKLKNNNAAYLFVVIGNKIKGVGSVERQKDRQAHVGLLGISLSRDVRGEGIGGELFGTLIEEGKKMGLSMLYIRCFEGNEPALKMYEKFGFKKAGFVPGVNLYRGDYIGEVILYLNI